MWILTIGADINDPYNHIVLNDPDFIMKYIKPSIRKPKCLSQS
jgi:hypothetical protein